MIARHVRGVQGDVVVRAHLEKLPGDAEPRSLDCAQAGPYLVLLMYLNLDLTTFLKSARP